ncbi:MAG: ergothioneine biosynthesis protein EgtC, partial [Alphaproteobacteria bacterium]
ELVYAPEHSLEVQAYAPREMSSGILNADGFGIAWYDRARRAAPFTYRNVLPIWNDENLRGLASYVESSCILGYVRSATPGQSLDYANCQPFARGRLASVHNGFVAEFRATLRQNLRGRLSPAAEDAILGSTDSEHLFAWLLHHLPDAADLATALKTSMAVLDELAPDIEMTLNHVVSDGSQLVALRLAHGTEAPSLYWLAGHARFPEAVIIASEPLFDDPGWRRCPEESVISVGEDLDVRIAPARG